MSSTSQHQNLVDRILVALTHAGALAFEIRPYEGQTPIGYVRAGVHPGASDIVAIYQGHVAWIEVKTGCGRLTKAQEIFRQAILDHGGTYIVARSVEDALRVFAEGMR